jgi:hypothetical protein
MGAMVVEVGPEIQQFILQICARPEQHVIQIFASNGANEPFHEGMRLGDVGDGVITENLVCMPTPSAGEKEKMIEAALKWCSKRVLDRKAGNAKRNPVSAREEIALVYKTTGCYRTR